MATQNLVPKLYTGVVDDVIDNVREAFLDEGVDEQVLQELKQLWSSKLTQSKAVEVPKEKPAPMAGAFAQQHQLLQREQVRQQRQQQGQIATQPAAVARAQATTQVQQAAAQPQAQLPVFNQATGALEMSGAAQAATRALPQQLLQQQIAALQGQLQPGQSIAINQGGNQYILQATPTGQHVLIQTQQAPQPQPQQNFTLAAQPAQDAQQQQQQPQPTQQGLIQLDGANDSSSDDDDDDDDDDDKDDENDDEENEGADDIGEEEEPLNSNDDVSEDEDQSDVFDTDNVVVCQFDKINRAKNKWKFHLKDGIMNLNGKDYVFQKGTGEADW